MLENSKGTTEYDDNFVKGIPGFTPTTDWSQVQVVPNPFISILLMKTMNMN